MSCSELSVKRRRICSSAEDSALSNSGNTAIHEGNSGLPKPNFEASLPIVNSIDKVETGIDSKQFVTDSQEIRWLQVSNAIDEGDFWLQHSIPAPGGGLYINRCDKRRLLEARMDAYEFLAACGRLRCTFNPYRVSRLLGGGRRNAAWCAALFQTLQRTTEQHYRCHRKEMYRGTLVRTYREDLRHIIGAGEDDNRNVKPENDVEEVGATGNLETIDVVVEEEARNVQKTPLRRESMVGMLDFDSESDEIGNSNGTPKEVSTITKDENENELEPLIEALSRPVRSSRLRASSVSDGKEVSFVPVDAKAKDPPALLCDSDTEEADYEACAEALFTAPARYYASELTCGEALTLAEFVTFCRAKAPQSFRDWGQKHISDTKSDLPWWRKPHLRIGPSGSVKQSTNIGRRWTIVGKRFRARCALVRTDMLLDNWMHSAIQTTRQSHVATAIPPLAFDPHAQHFLAVSAARFAIRVFTVAAWNSRPSVTDLSVADFARVVTAADVDYALQRLSSTGSLPYSIAKLEMGSHIRQTTDRRGGAEIRGSTEFGRIELCAELPVTAVYFPNNIHKEVERVGDLLEKCAKEHNEISSGSQSSFYSESSLMVDSGVDEDSCAYMNKSGRPFPVYGLADCESKDEGLGLKARDCIKHSDDEAAVKHRPVDTSVLSDLIHGDIDELSITTRVVCYRRLAWTCLHALGIELGCKDNLKSEDGIRMNCSGSSPANRIVNDQVRLYGSICEFSDFGVAGVPGLLSVCQSAMSKLGAIVDNFVELEADVLAACAMHDGGRPWIDRADAILMCAVRKDKMPGTLT